MSKRNVPLAPAPGELAEGGPQAGRAVPKLQKNERPGPARRPSMAAWVSLLIVWLVWGSTYLAIRGGVETIPPLLRAAARNGVAGLIMFPLALRSHRAAARAPGGTGSPWPSWAQWRGCAIVGGLLLGGHRAGGRGGEKG